MKGNLPRGVESSTTAASECSLAIAPPVATAEQLSYPRSVMVVSKWMKIALIFIQQKNGAIGEKSEPFPIAFRKAISGKS